MIVLVKLFLSASSHDKSMKDKKLNPQEIAFKVGELIGGLINDKKLVRRLLLIEVLIYIMEE